MTTDEHPGIRIEIEIMPGYRPPARVAAALAELSDALDEAADVDVDGYAVFTKYDGIRVDPLQGAQPLQSLSRSLVNNEVIEGVFKF